MMFELVVPEIEDDYKKTLHILYCDDGKKVTLSIDDEESKMISICIDILDFKRIFKILN